MTFAGLSPTSLLRDQFLELKWHGGKIHFPILLSHLDRSREGSEAGEGRSHVMEQWYKVLSSRILSLSVMALRHVQ